MENVTKINVYSNTVKTKRYNRRVSVFKSDNKEDLNFIMFRRICDKGTVPNSSECIIINDCILQTTVAVSDESLEMLYHSLQYYFKYVKPKI